MDVYSQRMAVLRVQMAVIVIQTIPGTVCLESNLPSLRLQALAIGKEKAMIELKKKDEDFVGIRLCAKASNPKMDDKPFAGVIQIKDGIVCGTDGHRLARYVLKGKELSGLNGLYSVLKNNQNLVQLQPLPKDSIHFPDTEPVISHKPKYTVSVDRLELVRGCMQMAVLSSVYYKGMSMRFSKNNLHLSIVNPDYGDAETDVVIKSRYAQLEIGINIQYVLDMITNMQSETIKLGVTDPSSPVSFAGENDEGFLGIIMPMRL